MRRRFALVGPVENIRVYNGGGARIVFADGSDERCSEALEHALRTEVANKELLPLLGTTPRMYAVLDDEEGIVVRLINLPPEDMGHYLLPDLFNRTVRMNRFGGSIRCGIDRARVASKPHWTPS